MKNGHLNELENLSRLIDHIYRGATDPQAWLGIIENIAGWLNAPKALLLTPQTPLLEGGFVFPHGFTQDVLELWATRYQHMDLWARRGIERGLIVQGNVAIGDEFVSAAELKASQWYQEFLSLDDVFQLLTSVVFDGSDRQHPIVVCAAYRGFHADRFETEDKRKLSLILPHISRALGVMLKLRDAELKTAASLSALDRIAFGILLVKEDRSVVFANRAAKRLLAEEDGLSLRDTGREAGEQLHSRDFETRAAIDEALGNTLNPAAREVPHFGHGVRVSRPSGRLPYVLQFSSLADDNEFGKDSDAPRAIVFISSSNEQIEVAPELLRRVYGLTPAEIRVATLLCQEGSVEEIAVKLGVSANTVKTQLQHIYQKVGIDNRVKLTRLMVSLAVAH